MHINKLSSRATVKTNFVTAGQTGKVGNLVFRMRAKETTAYVQSSRKVPLSEKQIEARIDFRIALIHAKNTLGIICDKFDMLAKRGKESAYFATGSNFFKLIHK